VVYSLDPVAAGMSYFGVLFGVIASGTMGPVFVADAG
jgi:hypothetical protein